MPVTRIEVPEGTSKDKKQRLRQGAKQAVIDTLAPKETKYDYVAIREVFGEIGDGIPGCRQVNLTMARLKQSIDL
jgi:hypothetical protein